MHNQSIQSLASRISKSMQSKAVAVGYFPAGEGAFDNSSFDHICSEVLTKEVAVRIMDGIQSRIIKTNISE